MKKEGDFSEVSYVLGIMSIVTAFFLPLAGFVFGIIGLIHSKKQKTKLSEKAKKFNIIGIILSIILFVITILAATYLTVLGTNPFI
jgi:uncharacterized membrane protein